MLIAQSESVVRYRVRRISVLTLIVLGLGVLAGCPPIKVTIPGGQDDDTSCRCDEGVQVSLEVHFVTVTDSFLEDVGVDLNTTLQLESAQPAVRSFFPATFTGDPLASYLGLPGAATGDAVAGLSPDSSTTPLSLLSTVLDSTQFDSVLAALAAQQGAQILTGPTITLQGGQSAFVLLLNEQRFLSDVATDVVNALTAIDPLIPALNTGPALELELRGLQDNADLVLTLRPSVGGTFNTPDVTGDRPIVRLAGIQTTLLVPDGQTVILGGVVDSTTSTRTSGTVPLLGNVPIIGRLFDNRQYVDDDDNLMIFITPRLINDE